MIISQIKLYFRKFGSNFYWLLFLQFLFVCFFLPGNAVVAAEVVVVIEGRQWPYEKAFEGILEDCACSPEVFHLHETPSIIGLRKKIASLRPRLLVAIGSKSLEFILSSDLDLPVVYSMVLNPWSKVPAGLEEVTGVSMNVSPRMYWKAMDHIKPAIQTVGLVYNPAFTEILKEHAEKLAVEHGQKLIALPASSPKEALHAIKNMASKIDAFWMLPDQTLIRQEVIDTLILSSLEHHFVLIGLSGKYVRAGALMAYSFNSKAIGNSAGSMVNAFLNSMPQVGSNSMWAPDTELTVNLKTAHKIGVVIDASFLERAGTVIE